MSQPVLDDDIPMYDHTNIYKRPPTTDRLNNAVSAMNNPW